MAKKTKKPTTAERDNRITKVYKLLLDGSSRPEIMEYCSKNWGLQRAATDNLIQEATKQIQSDLESVRPSALASTIKKQRDLYQQALVMNNLGVARQVLMDTAKLLGLDNHATTVVLEDKRELYNKTDAELAVLYEHSSS